jgi:hypothetical protein
MHNETAKKRFNLGFETSFNIRFLPESGGIFAHSQEKNKEWDGAEICGIARTSAARSRMSQPYPPAIAPITMKGSFPDATASGSGASGEA